MASVTGILQNLVSLGFLMRNSAIRTSSELAFYSRGFFKMLTSVTLGNWNTLKATSMFEMANIREIIN